MPLSFAMLWGTYMVKISFSIFCILIIDIVCVTAIVLSMGTQFVNKEEFVSGTRSEDSVTQCLSSLRVLTEMYIYIFFCLVVLFDKKNLHGHISFSCQLWFSLFFHI